jgi:hypothetical protein
MGAITPERQTAIRHVVLKEVPELVIVNNESTLLDLKETAMDHSGKRYLLQPFLAVLWRCRGLQLLFKGHKTRINTNRQEGRDCSATLLPQLNAHDSIAVTTVAQHGDPDLHKPIQGALRFHQHSFGH